MWLSRALAVFLGIFVPIAETVRRWNTWRELPLTLIEDYALAALVLYGAWLVGRDFRSGQRFLAAAWGVVCGVGYCSVVGQWNRIQTGEPDPAPVPSTWVLAIKIALFVLGIVALIATLKARETDQLASRDENAISP
jgi:hypothetical protein